jgi:hypothetical protein
MGGIGGWGGHKLDGTFEVRIFEAPSGTSVASFTRGDMLGGDIKREPLPSKYQPPAYRWRVPYQRNWTVQTSDLAGSVSATRRAFLSQDVRLAEASSATIQTDHPFAQDRDPVASYFKNQADAAAEAARLIDLFKTTRAIYRMTVPRRALRRDVGDEITVTHPRFDLSQGRAMIVLETAVNVVVQDGRRQRGDRRLWLTPRWSSTTMPTAGIVSASSQVLTLPASNLKTPHPSERWRSLNAADWIVLDKGASISPTRSGCSA